MLKVTCVKLTDIISSGRSVEWFRPFVNASVYESALAYRSAARSLTKLVGEWIVRDFVKRFQGLGKADFTIVYGEHGKPYIAGLEHIFFNLSHSGDYVVCAFSDSEVGMDIEKVGSVRMGVARRFFHPGEIKKLEALSAELQDDLFFRYWTVKESFLKYTGSGLSVPLSSFEVRFAGSEVFLYKAGIAFSGIQAEHSLFVRECAIDPDYKCFVTSEKNEVPELIPIKF